MISSWWWIWMMFMLFVIVSPVGYGWGYRGWGPPYPSYIQRRRHEQATALGGSQEFNHRAWGWGGDFVWIALVIGVVWVLTSFWWRS